MTRHKVSMSFSLFRAAACSSLGPTSRHLKIAAKHEIHEDNLQLEAGTDRNNWPRLQTPGRRDVGD